MRTLLIVALLLAPGLHAESLQPRSMAEALGQPQSKLFWLERRGGKISTGDPASRFDASRDAGEITFDIGNRS